MFCGKCGNEVKEGSKFCKNCGNMIKVIDNDVNAQGSEEVKMKGVQNLLQKLSEQIDYEPLKISELNVVNEPLVNEIKGSEIPITSDVEEARQQIVAVSNTNLSISDNVTQLKTLNQNYVANKGNSSKLKVIGIIVITIILTFSVIFYKFNNQIMSQFYYYLSSNYKNFDLDKSLAYAEKSEKKLELQKTNKLIGSIYVIKAGKIVDSNSVECIELLKKSINYDRNSDVSDMFNKAYKNYINKLSETDYKKAVVILDEANDYLNEESKREMLVKITTTLVKSQYFSREINGIFVDDVDGDKKNEVAVLYQSDNNSHLRIFSLDKDRLYSTDYKYFASNKSNSFTYEDIIGNKEKQLVIKSSTYPDSERLDIYKWKKSQLSYVFSKESKDKINLVDTNNDGIKEIVIESTIQNDPQNRKIVDKYSYLNNQYFWSSVQTKYPDGKNFVLPISPEDIAKSFLIACIYGYNDEIDKMRFNTNDRYHDIYYDKKSPVLTFSSESKNVISNVKAQLNSSNKYTYDEKYYQVEVSSNSYQFAKTVYLVNAGGNWKVYGID